MPRFALGVEYDGTEFVGWQHQDNGRSVQAVLSAAVSSVADEAVELHAAGRTDAGVHASGQVVHFDARAERDERQWRLGVNSRLPPDIAVQWARRIDSSFDARRSAIARRYRYLVLCDESRSALARRCVWWQHAPLSLGAMTAAATACLGERDFSAFRAANCQSRTPMRHLMAVALRRDGPLVALEFTANAFLYHMVRNLVGTLVEIGRGKAPAAWMSELLAGGDRTRAAATAPACGLTLVEVRYDARHGLPAARSLRLPIC